jgi:hypothetical protein
MNWLAKYRLNPDWFFPDDESETEKTNREEIFELIRNHDLLVNEKLENRDAKISHLVGEDYLDPLISLNPYIDFLYGKLDMTMVMPNIVVNYESEGTFTSKNISANTINFNSIEEMSRWIDDIRKDNELLVYLIERTISGNKFSLRCATIPKELNIIKPKRFLEVFNFQ